MWYYRNYKKVWGIIFVVISIITLIAYILINQVAQFVQSDYGSATNEIFKRGNMLFLLIFVTLAPFGSSYMFANHFTRRLFITSYEHFGEKLTDETSIFRLGYIDKNEQLKAFSRKHFSKER